MKLLAAILFCALVGAQGPPDGVAPPEPSPEGCEQTVEGNFTLGTLVKGSMKRDSASALMATDNLVQCSLKDGVLHDAHGWTGSIVANYQFQFDGPPQAGAIYTGGWSVCQNNSLAIGPNTTFYHCMSGAFANLYSASIGGQCQPVDIVVSFVNKPSASSSSAAPSSTETSGTVEPASSSTTNGPSNISATDAVSSTQVPTTATSTATSIPTSTPSVPIAPNADGTTPTNAAVPSRVPRRETFGAVVGILGAALML